MSLQKRCFGYQLQSLHRRPVYPAVYVLDSSIQTHFPSRLLKRGYNEEEADKENQARQGRCTQLQGCY